MRRRLHSKTSQSMDTEPRWADTDSGFTNILGKGRRGRLGGQLVQGDAIQGMNKWYDQTVEPEWFDTACLGKFFKGVVSCCLTLFCMLTYADVC